MPDRALSRAVADPSVAGFYGKLPGRGDFLRAGLPRSFTDPWDAWVQHVLPASRLRLGTGWLDAWLVAPIWRFRLSPGVCGPHGALGVWMASVDSIGRHFPLVLAHLGTPAPGDWFLAAAERTGLAAVTADLPPERITERLRDDGGEAGLPPPDDTPAPSLWWTEGGPRRPAGALALPAMPDAATFARMLEEPPT